MSVNTVAEFPFSAIVGQERLKESLILNAIYPAIGGVLIFGEKGTAKSTAARGLRALLQLGSVDHAVSLVDLPLSATEERVVGTLNIPETLKRESIQIEYGLLHKAHSGILYIDEVNLLEDHLVNIILDAAAMGINRIEREGISHEHPSRFLLVGTMNPEEGELRPQFLDRFGLAVQITTEKDPKARKAIIERRLTWENDPAVFAQSWKAAEEQLHQKIKNAQTLLPEVVLPDAMLDRILEQVMVSGAEGHRAELVIHKTARGLAALNGRREVNEDDVIRAAEYALLHRGHVPPASPPASGNQSPPQAEETSSTNTQSESPQGNHANSLYQAEQPPAPQPHKTLEFHSTCKQTGALGRGTRSGQQTERGRTRGYSDRPENAFSVSSVALYPTLAQAARRGISALSQIRSRDLKFKRKESRRRELHILVIDTSASMGTRQRLSLAKGLIQRLLKTDYQKKHFVGLVDTQGDEARVLLPPTRNLVHLETLLDNLQARGRTPLFHALDRAFALFRRARKRSGRWLYRLIILSDGKINVAFGNSIREDLTFFSNRIKKLKLPCVVIDTNTARAQSILLKEMARISGGTYWPIAEIQDRQWISV